MSLAKLANNDVGILCMKQVNIFDAKTELSKLIKMLEDKQEEKIIIARNGKPVAQILPYVQNDSSKRIGLGVGKLGYIDWDAFDAMDKEISDMFEEALSDEDFA